METCLKVIYEDLVSISIQLKDIRNKFMSLNWEGKTGGSYITTATDEWIPMWAMDEAEIIKGKVMALFSKMWTLPEVNRHDLKALEIKKMEQKLNVMKGEAWKNNEYKVS